MWIRKEGQFEFAEGTDLWRLLAKITLRKSLLQIKHHQAAKRDVSSEASVHGGESTASGESLATDREPSPVDANIFIEELQAVLVELSPAYRGIIELRLQGYPIREIAERQSCSERTIHRASEHFKRILEGRAQSAEKKI